MKLTQKRLKEVLHYDPSTGIFTWLVALSKKVKIGDIAGHIDSKGYRHIGVDCDVYRASRLAWLYMEGYFPEHEVDHEDRVRHNDRWKNLRHLTHSCNLKNRGVNSNNTSGITGVYWDKCEQKWRARIKIVGERKHLGNFKDFIDAVKARHRAEVEYNWPDCNSSSSAFNYLQKWMINYAT